MLLLLLNELLRKVQFHHNQPHLEQLDDHKFDDDVSTRRGQRWGGGGGGGGKGYHRRGSGRGNLGHDMLAKRSVNCSSSALSCYTSQADVTVNQVG